MGENDLTPFDYRKPSEANVVRIEELREAYKTLYAALKDLRPSRELSVAITKLEESSHWAVKSLVLNEQ
jgi:hypothetical protein